MSPDMFPARSTLSQRGVVSAADLASADIVVTTYDVLRSDLSRQPDTEGASGASRVMRRGKRCVGAGGT